MRTFEVRNRMLGQLILPLPNLWALVHFNINRTRTQNLFFVSETSEVLRIIIRLSWCILNLIFSRLALTNASSRRGRGRAGLHLDGVLNFDHLERGRHDFCVAQKATGCSLCQFWRSRTLRGGQNPRFWGVQNVVSNFQCCEWVVVVGWLVWKFWYGNYSD